MAQEVTYESLQADPEFLGPAYWFLQDIGESVSSNPEDILETFLEKRRAFEANIVSTYSQGETIKESSDETKLLYKKAMDKLDQLPSFFESGGAPMGQALVDYGWYGILDPTNLLSALAGAGTLGVGSGLAFGFKEAAKQGVGAMLKAKLKAAVSKPVLKALALEGSIAGAGGVGQNLLSQDVDMEVGRKNPEDGYDYASAALQGILEGTLSPLAGVGVNLTGSAIGKGISDTSAGKWGRQWIKNNFLPPGSQDIQALRLLENSRNEFKSVVEDAEVNAGKIRAIEDSLKKEVGPDKAHTIKDGINDIMDLKDKDTDSEIAAFQQMIQRAESRGESTEKILENMKPALKQKEVYDNIRAANPEIDSLIDKFKGHRDFLQAEGEKVPYINDHLMSKYFRSENYWKDVHEKYYTYRMDFDKFLELPENKNYKNSGSSLFEHYRDLVLNDERQLLELGIKDRFDPKGDAPIASAYRHNNGTVNMKAIERKLLDQMEKDYKPVLNQQAKWGSTFEVRDVPEVIRQLYGVNFSPAVRALETVKGLVNTITDMRMMGSVVNNLTMRDLRQRDIIIDRIMTENPGLTRDLATTQANREMEEGQLKQIVIAGDENQASVLSGGKKMVRLISDRNKKRDDMEPIYNNDGTRVDIGGEIDNPEAVFFIPGGGDRAGMSPHIPGGMRQVPLRTIHRTPEDGLNLGVAETRPPSKREYSYQKETVYDEQTKRFNEQFKLDADGNKIPRKDNEGNDIYVDIDPLTGKPTPYDVSDQHYFVTEDFAQMMKEMLNTENLLGSPTAEMGRGHKNLIGALNFFAEHQGYLKKGKTVYNPIAIVRNILGAGGYMINTGNMSGMYHLAKFLVSASPQEKLRIKETMTKLGLKGSQIELNQIINRIGKVNIGEKIRKRDWARKIAAGQVLGALEGTKLDRGLVKLYGITDDYGKLGTWFSERMSEARIWKSFQENNPDEIIKIRKAYSDAYDKPNERAIMEGAFDEKIIDELAVQKTLNIVPVYSRIPKILEKVRGLPVIGNFAAFPAENLRNKYYLFKIAGDELVKGFETGNMQLVRAGVRRLLAQSGYAAAPATMAYFYNQLEGTGDALEAIRNGLAPYQKDHAIAVRKGKKGKFFYTDLTYSNTDAAVLDIIMPFIMSAARGENPGEALVEVFPRAAWGYLSSFMEPSLATEVITDFVEYAKADTDEEQAKILARMGKTMVPGFLKSIVESGADLGAFNQSEYLSQAERYFKPLFYGEDRKRFEDSADLSSFLARHSINTKYGPLLATFGIVSGEQEFNPAKVFGYVSRDVQRNVLKDIQSTKREMISKIGDPTLSYDYKDMLKEYEELFEEQFAAQQQLAKLIHSYSKIMPKNDLQLMIRRKDIRGSLSMEQINHINSYRFSPEKLSDDFISKVRKAYLKAYKQGKELPSSFNKVISDIRAIHHRWNRLELEADIDR